MSGFGATVLDKRTVEVRPTTNYVHYRLFLRSKHLASCATVNPIHFLILVGNVAATYAAVIPSYWSERREANMRLLMASIWACWNQTKWLCYPNLQGSQFVNISDRWLNYVKETDKVETNRKWLYCNQAYASPRSELDAYISSQRNKHKLFS